MGCLGDPSPEPVMAPGGVMLPSRVSMEEAGEWQTDQPPARLPGGCERGHGSRADLLAPGLLRYGAVLHTCNAAVVVLHCWLCGLGQSPVHEYGGYLATVWGTQAATPRLGYSMGASSPHRIDGDDSGLTWCVLYVALCTCASSSCLCGCEGSRLRGLRGTLPPCPFSTTPEGSTCCRRIVPLDSRAPRYAGVDGHPA